MYFQLSEGIKRRMINEVKKCFTDYMPKHREVVDFVQPKYVFDSRPQKGVVVSITSTNPEYLSADNFQGTVISHLMLSRVEDFPNHAVEWVKEDHLALQGTSGFPADPGIYYIDFYSSEALEETLSTQAFDDVEETVGESPYYFYVDPLLSKKDEPVAESTDQNDLDGRTFYTLSDSFIEGSLRVYTDQYQLSSAPRLTISSNESLLVESAPGELGLESKQASVRVLSGEIESFDITSNQNDELSFEINGRRVDMTLDDGFRFASGIKDEIVQALMNAGMSSRRYDVFTEGGAVGIEASESLRFLDTSNTSLDELGFDVGYVRPEIKGDLFVPSIESDTELSLRVDGRSYKIPLYQTSQVDLPSLVNTLEEETDQQLSASYEIGGDYRADPENGEITLLTSFPSGTKVKSSYRHSVDSKGPYAIDEKQSHNEAIPGAVLAFGSRLQDRDKQAVVVHRDRKDVAYEYGGRWNVDVEMNIIARDDLTRGEMTDALSTWFFTRRKGKLSEEGIEITDISTGGEQAETYQDEEQNYYFLNSVTMSLKTDWLLHVPKPLVIERVRPTTRKKYDLRVAGQRNQQHPDVDATTVKQTGEYTLDEGREVYVVGKDKQDFERIQ
jgi:hypothetical protein